MRSLQDYSASCVCEPQDPGSLWSSQRHVHTHAHTCTHLYLPGHTCTIHTHIHTCYCYHLSSSCCFPEFLFHLQPHKMCTRTGFVSSQDLVCSQLSRTFSEVAIGGRRVDTGRWGRVANGVLHFAGCIHSCSHWDGSRYRQSCIPTQGQT